MSFVSYAGGNPMYGSTPVDNMFLTEFMVSAPKDYIPVYLYGLMLSKTAGCDGSIESIAEALNIDSDTVINAFRYWERQGIVEKMSDDPPTYNFVALYPERFKDKDDGVYCNREYFRELQSRMPNLVLDGHELRLACEWEDDLHLKQETILFMIDMEIAKRGGKLPTAQTLFKHLNETAMKLAEAGALELDAAREFLALESSYAMTAKAVCKQFSFRRNPTVDEIALATKWTDVWKLDINAIVEACAETVKSGNPSFAYLDKILESRISGSSDDGFEQVKKLCTHLGIVTRPTPAQMDAYREFTAMGFEFAAIEQAAVWCGENNRRTFDDIRKKLEAWAKEGAFTLQDIEEKAAEQKKYMEIVKRIFESSAVDRKITLSDIKLAKVWTALIEPEAVYYAATLAVGSTNPMQYINRIIQDWSAHGVTTLEKAKAAGTASGSASSAGKAKKPLDEREVTEGEFENGFFADIMNRQRSSGNEQK